jgi:hypothetical protein
MSGTIYGVVTYDPVTGKPAAVHADIEWNLGMAANVAETLNGKVMQAERGPWSMTPEEDVEAALEATKQAAVEDELRRMLDAAGESQ